MAKITLSNVLSGFNLSKINANFTAIAEALNNKVLWRNNPTGEPNQLENDLDVNGKRVYNLPIPSASSEAARLQDVTNALNGVTGTNPYPANLIPASDGASGSLFTNVQGFISKILSNSGSSIIGYIASYTGSVFRYVQDKLRESVSVKDFGAKGDGSTDDVAAIQACIFASMGMTNISDTPLAKPKFIVKIPSGDFIVSSGSIYIPTRAIVIGEGLSTKLITTSNNPVFILGQDINETNALVHRIENLSLYGNLTGSNQIGLRIGINGGYVLENILRNIYIRDMGGHGIYYASSNLSSMILYSTWENVHVTNTKGYCVYIRSAVFNDALFQRCDFEEGLLGGFYVDYLGGGTTNFSETINFDTCSFEGNGQLIGDGSVYTAGSFGFRSSMYGGQYTFNNCYIENNGMRIGDTTGAGIYCRAPVMLSIKNSYLVGANNLVYMYAGGCAELEGCYIEPKVNNTALFTFDTNNDIGAPDSYLRVGINKWYQQYIPDSKFFRRINGATTQIIGYRNGRTNYLTNQPRHKNQILRDVSDVDANTGAISYNAVKRLTNTADGTYSVGVDSTAYVSSNAVYTLALISDSYNSKSALFLICPTGIQLVSQVGSLFTTTKDNTNTINVYFDAGSSNYTLQNKTANALQYLAVRFIGAEAMLHADDYSHYEANYLQTL